MTGIPIKTDGVGGTGSLIEGPKKGTLPADMPASPAKTVPENPLIAEHNDLVAHWVASLNHLPTARDLVLQENYYRRYRALIAGPGWLSLMNERPTTTTRERPPGAR